MLYWLGYLLAWILFRIIFRLRVVGKEHLRAAWKHGGVLLACNHASYFDPPIVGVAYRKKVTFLARKTLFKEGFWAWIYPRLNAIPVDQERPDFTSLKRIIKDLRQGKPVLIFPEGERSIEGGLLDGQPGVGLVIAKAKVPVLPMRLFGAYEALPRGSSKPRWFTKITLCVGEPFELSEAELSVKGRGGYQAITDRVMQAISEIEEPHDS